MLVLKEIKRYYNLNKLLIDTSDVDCDKLLNYLKINFSNLNCYNLNGDIDHLFYGKDIDNISLKYIIDESMFYVIFKDGISIFEREYNVNRYDMCDIIKWWCDIESNIESGEFRTFYGASFNVVNSHSRYE